MAHVIEVRNAKKHFKVASGVFGSLRAGGVVVKAVDGVSFNLKPGESVGILGESGCGKTTMGRLLLNLTELTDGEIVFEGKPLSAFTKPDLKAYRRRAQLIFQNPFESLNPRFTVRASMSEPLENAGVPVSERREKIDWALSLVKLPDPAGFLDRYPHQLSGGQLQRIGMARALILEPTFVVADEPVSMLDVSVRAGILNVFRDVRDSLSLTAIYISHDLALVRYVCHRTIVMYLGVIVEDGPTEDIVADPLHPYTKALVAAVPVPHPDQPRGPLPVEGGAPDARNPPSGCRFRDRCPQAMARCAQEQPGATTVGSRTVFCHLFDE
jgi:peptide/nickel transport system ATP-binding protein